MKKAVNLESERLVFSALTRKHCSQFYTDWMNDNDTIRFLETGGNYTIKKLENFLIEQEQKNILFWAIHLKESNKHIGNIKIDPINYDQNSGEYGIMMGDKTFWGKGFANEASNRIIKYCFEELKLSSITLGVVEDNINAIKLYKKIGFNITKRINDSGTYDNKLCNSLRMSLHVKNCK